MTAPHTIGPGRPITVGAHQFPHSPTTALPRSRVAAPQYATPGQPGLYPPLWPGGPPVYLTWAQLHPGTPWGLDRNGQEVTTPRRAPTRQGRRFKLLGAGALCALVVLPAAPALAVAGAPVAVGGVALALSFAAMGVLRRLGLTRPRPRRKYPY